MKKMKFINPNQTFNPLVKSYPFIKGDFRRLITAIYSLVKFNKLYFHGLKRPSFNLKTKFFIVCIPRSGSMLLGSLLSSNDLVHWDGELFRFNSFLPGILANGFANTNNVAYWGAKLFLHEINPGTNTHSVLKVLQKMNKNGWKFIFLTRENSFKQAISFEKFIQGGAGYALKDQVHKEDNRYFINIERFIKTLKWCEEFKNLQKEMMLHVPHLHVIYEEQIEQEHMIKKTMDEIFDFLEIPKVHVNTNHVKQSSKRLKDQIINYEELIEAVLNTDFGKYLV